LRPKIGKNQQEAVTKPTWFSHRFFVTIASVIAIKWRFDEE